jgi:Uma2 family endonuclease
VISRTRKDHRRDRQDKALDYVRWGVPWYWLVDPEARTLEILRRDEDERYDRGALVSAGVLDVVPGCDGLVLDLDALWAEIDRLADIESDEA